MNNIRVEGVDSALIEAQSKNSSSLTGGAASE